MRDHFNFPIALSFRDNIGLGLHLTIGVVLQNFDSARHLSFKLFIENHQRRLPCRMDLLDLGLPMGLFLFQLSLNLRGGCTVKSTT